jgi:hypothetical protein
MNNLKRKALLQKKNIHMLSRKGPELMTTSICFCLNPNLTIHKNNIFNNEVQLSNSINLGIRLTKNFRKFKSLGPYAQRVRPGLSLNSV